MGSGERRVKRLDAQCRRVFGEPRRVHERDGAEAPDVAIVEVAAVVEDEAQRGVRRLRSGSGPRASSSAPVKRGCTTMRSPESRSRTTSLARRQARCDRDARSRDCASSAGGDLAQHVGLLDDDLGDAAAARSRDRGRERSSQSPGARALDRCIWRAISRQPMSARNCLPVEVARARRTPGCARCASLDAGRHRADGEHASARRDEAALAVALRAGVEDEHPVLGSAGRVMASPVRGVSG